MIKARLHDASASSLQCIALQQVITLNLVILC